MVHIHPYIKPYLMTVLTISESLIPSKKLDEHCLFIFTRSYKT